MKAIIVAAGVGSRLKGFTSKPKSTLDVDGTPLIVRTVDMLLSRGIEVAIAIGYRGDVIKELMGDRKVTYYFNPFFRITNSIASFWLCRDFIDDDLIIANADVFWEEGSLDVLLASKEDVTMLGDRSSGKEGDFVLKLDGNNRIIKYGKDLEECDRDSESVGVALLRKKFLPTFLKNLDELIAAEHHDMWWDNILYNYSDKYPVVVADISDRFWAEIDFVEDYERIMKYIRTKDVNSKYKS